MRPVAADNAWRRAAAVNACAGWEVFVTPLGENYGMIATGNHRYF